MWGEYRTALFKLKIVLQNNIIFLFTEIKGCKGQERSREGKPTEHRSRRCLMNSSTPMMSSTTVGCSRSSLPNRIGRRMSNLWYGSTKQGGERSSKTLAKIDTQGRSTERSGKLSSFNTKISVLKISQNRTTARPLPTNGRPWRRSTTSSPTTTSISTTGRHTARSFRRYLQCRTGTTGSKWFSTTSGFGKRSASKPFHNEGSSNCTTRRKMLRFS